jgi:Tol biopolymer transport system component
VLAEVAMAGVVHTCRPEPGLGTITYARAGKRHAVDLATCRERVEPGRPTKPRLLVAADGTVASVRVSKDWWTIVAHKGGSSRDVYRVSRRYHVVTDDTGPPELLGWSPDGRWILFVVDPDGSGSIQADGLVLRAVRAGGGRVVRIARMLVYRDYLTWCGDKLVFTEGGDRVATSHKRLLVTSPPGWRPRPLVRAAGRSWGSVACAPGGRWLVAQSQRESDNPSFFATHWALWRVGLDGSTRQLTSPPHGYTDESPRISRDGRTLMFVRSRKGTGKLYALRASKVVGPLLVFGNNTGYYGHHDWWLTADWSAGR